MKKYILLTDNEKHKIIPGIGKAQEESKNKLGEENISQITIYCIDEIMTVKAKNL